MPKRTKSSRKKSINQVIRQRRRELEKFRARQNREYERELKRHMKALEKIGAYRPTGKNLTKSRKREVRRRFRKFEEFLTGDYAFVFIRARKPDRRKKALDLARENQMVTAPKGIFIERTRDFVKARARRDRKTGEYEIVVEKKRRGETGERETTEIIPLKPLGALGDELIRIKRDAEKLGPLGKNDRLAFKVYVNDRDGYSHNIYGDPESLIFDLEQRYEQMVPWFKHVFFRSITVEKTSRTRWLTEHPRPDYNPYKQRANKTGRSRRVSKRKIKITVRRISDNWGVFLGDMLDSEWRTRADAMAEARRMRAALN
jgi:hypothetical protein